jgi:hypothetical protein
MLANLLFLKETFGFGLIIFLLFTLQEVMTF